MLHVVNSQSLDDSGLQLQDESDNVIEGEIEKTVDKLQGRYYYLKFIVRFKCVMFINFQVRYFSFHFRSYFVRRRG